MINEGNNEGNSRAEFWTGNVTHSGHHKSDVTNIAICRNNIWRWLISMQNMRSGVNRLHTNVWAPSRCPHRLESHHRHAKCTLRQEPGPRDGLRHVWRTKAVPQEDSPSIGTAAESELYTIVSCIFQPCTNLKPTTLASYCLTSPWQHPIDKVKLCTVGHFSSGMRHIPSIYALTHRPSSQAAAVQKEITWNIALFWSGYKPSGPRSCYTCRQRMNWFWLLVLLEGWVN